MLIGRNNFQYGNLTGLWPNCINRQLLPILIGSTDRMTCVKEKIMGNRRLQDMNKAELIAELERYRQLEVLFNATESIAHMGHYEWDYENGVLIDCSEQYARLFGMTVEEVIEDQSSWKETLTGIHPDDHEHYKKASIRLRNDRSVDVKYRIFRKDGEIRHIRETGVVVDNDGTDHGNFGFMQDITEREKYERDLENRDALAQQAESITDIGHFIYDEVEERYLYISNGFARIHGQTVEDLMSMRYSVEADLAGIHPDDRQRVADEYRHSIETGKDCAIEYRLFRSDGKERWIRELGKAHKMKNGRIEQTLGVMQDITPQKDAETQVLAAKEMLEATVEERTLELAETVKRLQEEISEREKIAAELSFLANHDALTGLPSLRLCKDRLERSLIESRRNNQMSGVMFIDLDGFKEVNDSFGHESGDIVLKVVADRIKAEIRETDTVARIGGDEFVVIMSSVPDLDIVEKVAANLVEQISESIQVDNNEVNIGASLGIALYPRDGNTPEELISQADRAMYQVKAAGKNNFGFLKAC